MKFVPEQSKLLSCVTVGLANGSLQVAEALQISVKKLMINFIID